MSKRFDIAGITHPLVDVVVQCEPTVIAKLGLAEGSWARTTLQQQMHLLDSLRGYPTEISPGASLANSIALAALLGRSGLVFGLAGDDEYGKLFVDGLAALNVRAGNEFIVGARTGTCVSLVNSTTGERTMRTCHGVSAEFGAPHATEELIAASSWLMLEGYFLTASQENTEGLYAAVHTARRCGTAVALTAAAEFIVRDKRDEILALLSSLDLLFTNETEALALTGAASAPEALAYLAAKVPRVIVTVGAQGALCIVQGEHFEVPAFPTRMVDTTGAGDAFAGAFLAGLSAGIAPQKAARGASRLAAQVVSQQGARLGSAAVSAWIAETA